ncbi:MAG: hypothetical protein ACK40K_07160, partial [Raineya sp.]
KKIIFIASLLLFHLLTLAQVDFSETPYSAPKNALNLKDFIGKKEVIMKVGQVFYFQCKGKYAMGDDEEAEKTLKQLPTHVYLHKDEPIETRTETSTLQWKAIKKGKAMVFVRLGEDEKEHRFHIVVK